MLDEFFMQGDKERSMGLAVSPGFDKFKICTDKQKAYAHSFFVGGLVKPLFETLNLLACPPEFNIQASPNRSARHTREGQGRGFVNLEQPLKNIAENLQILKKIVAGELDEPEEDEEDEEGEWEEEEEEEEEGGAMV